jgi:hypothetical protein
MPLPYENATSGERALGEIQKLLRGFGCQKFGNWSDEGAGELCIQFEYRGRPVSVKAHTKGYAAAWLRAHPHNSNHRYSEAKHRERAMDVASVAVHSILRDWIKGQITAIETGILSFEGAFLGQLLLGNGKTVLEHVEANKMLPQLEGPTP